MSKDNLILSFLAAIMGLCGWTLSKVVEMGESMSSIKVEIREIPQIKTDVAKLNTNTFFCIQSMKAAGVWIGGE